MASILAQGNAKDSRTTILELDNASLITVEKEVHKRSGSRVKLRIPQDQDGYHLVACLSRFMRERYKSKSADEVEKTMQIRKEPQMGWK